MNVRCEHCGLDMEAPPGSVGITLRCPGCGQTFVCTLPKAIVVPEPAGQESEQNEVVLLEEIVEDEQDDPLAWAGESDESPLDDARNRPPPLPPHPPPLPPPEAEEPDESPLEAIAAASVSTDKALEEMESASGPKKIVKENPRQWYIIVGGVAAVALTYQELLAKARQEEIKPRTKIFYAPEDLTLSAGDIPGLFPELDEKRKKKRRKKALPQVVKKVSPEAAGLADALGHMGEELDAEPDEDVQPEVALNQPSPKKSSDVADLAEALGQLDEEE